MLALIAMTSWAQKFTISGDLSVSDQQARPPPQRQISYILERLFEGYAYRIRREGREVRDKRETSAAPSIRNSWYQLEIVAGEKRHNYRRQRCLQRNMWPSGWLTRRPSASPTTTSPACKNSSTFLVSPTTKPSPPTAAVSAMTCDFRASGTSTMN